LSRTLHPSLPLPLDSAPTATPLPPPSQTLDGRQAVLQDMDGKQVSRTFTRTASLGAGAELTVGGFDVEVVHPVDAAEVRSGRIFIATFAGTAVAAAMPAPPAPSALKPRPLLHGPPAARLLPPAPPKGALGSSDHDATDGAPDALPAKENVPLPAMPRARLGVGAGLTRPLTARPRNDPSAPGALVLQAAPPAASDAASASASPGAAVVVDPFLTAVLRPHQRVGVRFLWECITGLRGTGSCGGILADAMGLGKTLQTIAVLWTALKQSSAGGTSPLVNKAVIVCPSSLVANWRAEFKKWLGDERCRPLAVTQLGKSASAAVVDFAQGSSSVHPVLIISYEMLRKHAAALTAASASGRVGLLVCDEGHRLKSSGGNKTIDALEALPAKRRLLLTGTPVQNNLEEFYAMANFVCPGFLGTLPAFKRTFEAPIVAGRDKGATRAASGLGAERAAELAARTSAFVLRRTAEILDKYLPPKTEAVVLCRLTPLQLALYRGVVAALARGSGSGGGGGGDAGADPNVLLALTLLRKVCAHPDLVHPALATSGILSQPASRAGTPTPEEGEAAAAARVKKPRAAVEAEEGEEDEDGGAMASDEEGEVAGGDADRDADADAELGGDDEEGDEFDLSALKGGGAAASKRGRQPSSSSSSSSSSTTTAALPASARDTILACFPPGYVPGLLSPKTGPAATAGAGASVLHSSKLVVLDRLLSLVRASHPSDRVVVVSNYAQTLDVVEGLFRLRGWPLLRLDGSTPGPARQELVGRFNDPSNASAFGFLLSAQAGGVGLNLIGANRLVMLDASWNPAVDKQALARVWRDGQKKHVHITRLLSAWTIEEKILQRQLLKEDMADALGGGGAGDAGAGPDGDGAAGSGAAGGHSRLSRAELKELFGLDASGGGGAASAKMTAGAASSAAGVVTRGPAGVSGVYGCDTAGVLAKGEGGKGNGKGGAAAASASASASAGGATAHATSRRPHAAIIDDDDEEEEGEGAAAAASSSSAAAAASRQDARPTLRSPWPPYAGPAAVEATDTVLAAALRQSLVSSGGVGEGGPAVEAASFVRSLVFNLAGGGGTGTTGGGAGAAAAAAAAAAAPAPAAAQGFPAPAWMADEEPLTDSDEDGAA
jgi:SNF2 family DNA or RNA helicase